MFLALGSQVVCVCYGEQVYRFHFCLSAVGHIDARVCLFNGAGFHFIGLSWVPLRSLSRVDNDQWMCCGYFNEILDVNEKTSDRLRRESQINEFRRAIEECGLLQFGFTG